MSVEENLAALTAATQEMMDTYGQNAAEYAALSANLKGVVNTEMDFSGTVDPDEAAPTNVNGGTFTTLKALIDAAPRGAFISATLLGGKVYPIASDINMYGQSLTVSRSGDGANPVLDFQGYISNNKNNLRAIRQTGNCSIRMSEIDVRLPNARPDPALGWSSFVAAFGYYTVTTLFLAMRNGQVTGGIASEIGLAINGAGSNTVLQLTGTTIDGPIVCVKDSDEGVSLVSADAVTLLNGAALVDGGTLGTDHLLS